MLMFLSIKFYCSNNCFPEQMNCLNILLTFAYKDVTFLNQYSIVGKTTRPFRYDLNQIPYDYIVEVTNRFKGLYLIDRVPEDLWTEVGDIIEEAVIKTIPKEKKCEKVV